MAEQDMSKVTSNDAGILSDEVFTAYQELLRESLGVDLTGGVYVVDELSNAVHSGNAYSVNLKATVTTGDSTSMLGRTGDKEVHFDHFTLSGSKGKFSIELFEAPTVTADGTPILSLNRHRASTNTASMSVYSGPTVTDNGTLMDDSTVYDTGGVGANVSQGQGGVDADWVLAANTEYLIVITNDDSTSTDFTGHFVWSERDPI